MTLICNTPFDCTYITYTNLILKKPVVTTRYKPLAGVLDQGNTKPNTHDDSADHQDESTPVRPRLKAINEVGIWGR